MTSKKLQGIVDYIVTRGLLAIKENAKGERAKLDYLAIFSRSSSEYRELMQTISKLGVEVDKKTNPTGHTFLLKAPLNTSAGSLPLLKIRKPDPTRPQRGAPDFKVANYKSFKKKYLVNGNNFTLMIRSGYEMMELKGKDVLVYFPNETLGDRIKISKAKQNPRGVYSVHPSGVNL